ncbi:MULTISPECIES: tRNA (guanine-N1)-methyltransferase [Zobellia]|uniref:tRNA (guanine-N1)-methyltransferase n=1 Tax=Zobellia TaxID=112040 RepID=UPI001BFFAFAE|nr:MULTISPECIES: tRNA (guanine-N1)-methyltransferase [Zobellia]MBT9188508.1 tRNA (guanine-N1)-methyltransferase [Zobellia russellii]MBU2976281.1 tRNA (guanine-N1)-methyltransferase [Zobellia sp. B3R18]MDO6819276.1 tRNA (guanine-N1)-methyltransferase [Zobellia sp. 1_MG-2023]
MKGLRILLLITALLAYNLQFAQEAEAQEELSLDKGPIDSQFEYIFTKSGNYRADGKKYEVVRTISLDKLRQNVLDTLKGYNKRAAELKATIGGHESTIGSLNKKLEETTNNLVAVTEEKDSMSFLGIMVSKSTYNGILWTVIASLLALLLFFIYRFRNSNILTQEAKTNLAELETEYEDHRRRALEREQKISRQLQDEINKYKKQK